MPACCCWGVLSFARWSLVAALTISCYIKQSETLEIWKAVQLPLKIFQTLAILEIIHSALGLVSTKVGVVLPQVFSRVFVVWVGVESCNASKSSIGLHLILIAWSITEIIRYSFYFFALLGDTPYILKFLRYTLFIVLYPIGVTGELLLCYQAYQEMTAKGKFSYEMPNKLNVIWKTNVLVLIYMLSYIPFFPPLYLHMFAQRKKTLSPAPTAKKLK